MPITQIAITMKWCNRKAQGFSPGDRQNATRPERAAELIGLHAASVRREGSHLRDYSWEIGWYRTSRISVALSGRSRGDAVPRAKALGYSLRPFHGQKQGRE
jgi:hypothetical protein